MSKDRYSIITLNDVNFGVNLIHLQEVCNLPKITPVPNSPQFLKGVFNLRGNVYGMVDFNEIVGLGQTRLQAESMAIVITNVHFSVGIFATRIHSILSFDKNSLIKDLSGITPNLERFVSAKFNDLKIGEIFILDVLKLLASSELTIYF